MSVAATNLDRMRQIGALLEAAGIRVVFVGGAVVPLHVDALGGGARPTDDLDCVVNARTYADYVRLMDRLRQLGFVDDPESGVTCRMRYQALVVDFLPLENVGVAPSSPFFEAIWGAPASLPDDNLNRILIAQAAPLFATKVEAFFDRGQSDMHASKDLEDLVTLLDGRFTLVDELIEAGDAVWDAAARWARFKLARRDLSDLVYGSISGPNLDERCAAVRDRITVLSNIAART